MTENTGTASLSAYTTPKPLLSVVVTVGVLRRRALRCIDAILAQQDAPPMQVIVADVDPGQGPIDRPGIVYLPLPGCDSINRAKAAGARLATAPVVAFLEDHCVPQPGWAAAVHQAFLLNPGLAAAAYSFGNLNPVNWVSRSFLLLAYGPWMGPAESGPVPTPSWMNVAYSREVLDKAPDLVDWMGCEGLFLHQLATQGARFWHAAGARVLHLNHPSLIGSAKDSACWQRVFASTRVRVERWNWFRRLFYFFAAVPLSPPIITFRLARRMWTRPGFRGQFLSALPLIYFVYTWGAFSEALGYVAGIGDAGQRTIFVETGDPRGESR